MRVGAVVLCALTMTACGGAGANDNDRGTNGADQATAVDAEYLETELPRAINDEYRGDSFSGVKCVERSRNIFRCVGDYSASRASVEQEMRSIDTSDFTEEDWQVLIEGRSGPASFEVTVDPSDGSFIYEPD